MRLKRNEPLYNAPQKILRATLLFSIYRNVKAPKLNPYLMDIPKDAEYPFHLHYFRYCLKVTDYKTRHAKAHRTVLAFFENHETMAFF